MSRILHKIAPVFSEFPEISETTPNINRTFTAEEEYIKKCRDGVLFDGKRIKVSEPKVSFLVPIYNKEKYLPLALRSVQNQSLRDIEIVCLDDGSTDNSEEVVEKFQKDDPRIVLYKHEKNMGTGTTRAHLGQYAKGKYLMWLDPDDAYCSPDAAKMAYEKAEKTGADIVHFKSLSGKLDEICIRTRRSPTISGIMKQPQLSHALYNRDDKDKELIAIDTANMWNKLFLKMTYIAAMNFLGEERWKEHLCVCEDLLQSFAIFNVAKCYAELDHIAYFYNYNPDSITHKLLATKHEKLVDQKKADYLISNRITACKFIFELSKNTAEGKSDAARILKRCFSKEKRKAYALSGCVDKIKDLMQMFLNCEYVSENDKKYIKEYLDDILKLSNANQTK